MKVFLHDMERMEHRSIAELLEMSKQPNHLHHAYKCVTTAGITASHLSSTVYP